MALMALEGFSSLTQPRRMLGSGPLGRVLPPSSFSLPPSSFVRAQFDISYCLYPCAASVSDDHKYMSAARSGSGVGSSPAVTHDRIGVPCSKGMAYSAR